MALLLDAQGAEITSSNCPLERSQLLQTDDSMRITLNMVGLQAVLERVACYVGDRAVAMKMTPTTIEIEPPHAAIRAASLRTSAV
jgi:hypothetical protein